MDRPILKINLQVSVGSLQFNLFAGFINEIPTPENSGHLFYQITDDKGFDDVKDCILFNLLTMVFGFITLHNHNHDSGRFVAQNFFSQLRTGHISQLVADNEQIEIRLLGQQEGLCPIWGIVYDIVMFLQFHGDKVR